MSPGAKNVGVVVGVGLLAGLVRAWGLIVVGGEGLGPDAPGALAAVTLGGHPYPLHPLLIGVLGGAGRLSVVSGAVMAAAMAFAAPRLGGSALGWASRWPARPCSSRSARSPAGTPRPWRWRRWAGR
ncbi:MAG: hypothetical protein IPN01_32480 [Deltaproteobacteria bacterium]|nr:hypothetical protein [Deltaproteobacteria bacterium]